MDENRKATFTRYGGVYLFATNLSATASGARAAPYPNTRTSESIWQLDRLQF